MKVDPEAGREAYWWAQPEVRVVILAHAEKRVESIIGRLDALNQRLSALCALLFAGAAVSATFTTNSDKVSHAAVRLACWAATAFVLGGAIGCIGLFSGKSPLPGEPPSWWARDDQARKALLQKTEADANYWLAGHYETVIGGLTVAVRRRGWAFNSALGLGVLAGSLIAAAAWVGMLNPVAKSPAAQNSVSSGTPGVGTSALAPSAPATAAPPPGPTKPPPAQTPPPAKAG